MDGVARTVRCRMEKPVCRGMDQPLLGWNRGSRSPKRVMPISPEVDFATESIEEVTQQVRESLEALVREAKQQEEASKAGPAAEQRSTQWASTPSIWPVRGWVTSAFTPGFRRSPKSRPGMTVWISACSGKFPRPGSGARACVVTVAFDSKMGNMVKLDHGYGIETVYGHLAKSLVKGSE